MSLFIRGARAVATAALVGGYAWMCPATAAADPNSDALAGMLSQGYNTSNCTPDTVSGGLAAYKCGLNPMPNGPTRAAYILYSNSDDTAAGFRGASGTVTLTPCKPGDPSPDAWNYNNSPNTSAGQIACGTASEDNVAMVVWTNDANHMVGIVGGGDQAGLYKWWQAYG
jgi:serine/threonine kinase PknH